MNNVTLFDWYVLHAPKEIPEWFTPEMDEPRPAEMENAYSVFYKLPFNDWLACELDQKNRVEKLRYKIDEFQAIVNAPGSMYAEAELDTMKQQQKELDAYQKHMKIVYNNISRWDAELVKERIIQWPFTWARMMLQERELLHDDIDTMNARASTLPDGKYPNNVLEIEALDVDKEINEFMKNPIIIRGETAKSGTINSEWIDIDEDLPEHEQEVILVYREVDGITKTVDIVITSRELNCETYFIANGNIPHIEMDRAIKWMPVPKY